MPDSERHHGHYQGGYIAMFSPKPDWHLLYIILHEVGHALDNSAYGVEHLSATKEWADEYYQDSRVPDEYAQNNPDEDLAQTTLVAAYDLNVPGGLGSLQGDYDWSSIRHQYEFIKKRQAEAGGLLIPGGTCISRVRNSEAVPITAIETRKAARGWYRPQTVEPNSEPETLQPTNLTSEPYDVPGSSRKVRRGITRMKGKPNVALAEGLKVIELRKGFSTEHTCQQH